MVTDTLKSSVRMIHLNMIYVIWKQLSIAMKHLYNQTQLGSKLLLLLTTSIKLSPNMDGKLNGFVFVIVYLCGMDSSECRLTIRLQKNINATKISTDNGSFTYPQPGVYYSGYGSLMGSLDVHSGFVSG